MPPSSRPASRLAYAYDQASGEFMGTVTVYLDPIKGSYPLPDHAVALEFTHDAHVSTVWRLTVPRDAWDLVADYRRTPLYDIDSAQAKNSDPLSRRRFGG